jgi:DNA-binding XRE family transcriptional regulator
MTGLEIELLRKGLRNGRGLTRKEFAKKIDVTETTVYRWETERSEPHQVFIDKMKTIGV